MTWQVIEADCVEAMKEMDEASVDAVVTDPPAGISFMGRAWDSDRSGGFVAWLASVMEEALRVTKPGGHALVWALPRTSHWTGSAIEAAGWEIRDRIAHHFGSGFPKSHNLSNGFGTALKPATEDWWLARKPLVGTVAQNVERFGTGALNIDGCRIDGAGAEAGRERHGGGVNDKYAQDEWTRENAATMGSGPMPAGRWPANICLSHAEGCVRIGERRVKGHAGYPNGPGGKSMHYSDQESRGEEVRPEAWQGHADSDGLETVEAWSCVEGCPVRELDLQSGELKSGRMSADTERHSRSMYGQGNGRPTDFDTYGDIGGASRFFATFQPCSDEPIGSEPSGGQKQGADPNESGTSASESGRSPTSAPLVASDARRFRYVAKASRAERNAGLEGFEAGQRPLAISQWEGQTNGSGEQMGPSSPQRNSHPTVKPVDLMRWLVRLVTPPDGLVLDPFCGSGTTGIACVLEDFDFIGIEREPEYVEIAKARIDYWAKQPKQLGLLDDLPPEKPKGRWPANVALSHLEGCELVGTKRVKGITGTAQGKMAGKNTEVYGDFDGSERAGEQTGYADADGLEIVDDWRCVEGCPVAELDKQSAA